MGTYGIDLGTTYSCIATLDRNGNPEVIRNQADASDTLASVVFFENADNVVVGNSAKDMVETDGDRVVQFVKREIGREGAKTYEFDGKTYTPVEISALILKRLKQMVEEQGGTVDDVVITCPAQFGFEQRNATKKAGELAGMNVLNLINEPTAAALSYCARQFQEERTILVYDLGGGTFDVTIMKMSMEQNEKGEEVQRVTVLATGGNSMLGGKDWDDRLYEFLLDACCKENNLQADDIDAETRQLIRSRVETTKKKLSSSESAKVKINVSSAMTTINVTREQFENLTSDKVAETMNFVEQTLKEVENIDIDMVLMVGGSTYMPMIYNAVNARFPGKVQIHEPDRSVAMGAAIYASMLVDEIMPDPGPITGPIYDPDPDFYSGQNSDPNTHVATTPGITIDDQVSRSFGPGVLNTDHEYIIDNLIKIGDPMNEPHVKTYFTSADNMKSIVLRAFENVSKENEIIPCVNRLGEDQPSDPLHNVKLLGQLVMELPPNTPQGAPIEITFRADGSGLYIKAVNVATGKDVNATIHMESDIDVANSAVNEIGIKAD